MAKIKPSDINTDLIDNKMKFPYIPLYRIIKNIVIFSRNNQDEWRYFTENDYIYKCFYIVSKTDDISVLKDMVLQGYLTLTPRGSSEPIFNITKKFLNAIGECINFDFDIPN